jgi:beta-lactamase regulating signal transducer with metallopeptidase domain
MSEALAIILAWLGTYLLHSTVMLGGAWLLTVHGASMPNAWKELLWRMALLAPIVTVTLQGAINPPTSYSAFTFSRDAATSSNLQNSSRVANRESAGAPARVQDDATNAWTLGETALAPLHAAVDAPPDTRDEAASSLRHHARSGRSSYLLIVGSVIAGGIVLMLIRARQVQRLLKDRRPVDDAVLRGVFDAMRLRSRATRRVRLTCSASINSPVAVGVLRPEICLPLRALSDLDGRQLRALLAHELAHHAGRDPLWLWIYQHIALLLPMQPLNRLARHRLRELAELRCDDRAAAEVGCRLTVARCLADVAAWLVPPIPTALAQTVPGMAQRPSMLRTRINRLLDERAAQGRGVGRLTAMIVLMLVIVAGTPLLPGVRRHSLAAINESMPPVHVASPSTDDASLPPDTINGVQGHLGQLHIQVEALTAQMAQMRRLADGLSEDDRRAFADAHTRLRDVRQRCAALQQAINDMQRLQEDISPLHDAADGPDPIIAADRVVADRTQTPSIPTGVSP